jgi:hypothetical protein
MEFSLRYVVAALLIIIVIFIAIMLFMQMGGETTQYIGSVSEWIGNILSPKVDIAVPGS